MSLDLPASYTKNYHFLKYVKKNISKNILIDYTDTVESSKFERSGGIF